MARLPEEFISQIKSANDIVDMFRTYADVKKRGRIYVCCCPFHSEKTPSCTIYPENSSFYCFGCHEGGDVIRFVMLTDNVSYIEAVKILAQRCGMTLPAMNPEEKSRASLRDKCYEINRETANFYYQNLLKGSDKTGLQYLKYYQIRPETVRKYAVGYASGEWQNLHYHLRQKGYSDTEISASGVCRKNQNGKLFDTFRNRIILPAVDFRGNVTGFGGRAVDNASPPFLYAGMQSENTVFSLNFAKKEMTSKFLILAEDYFTASAIYQAGFENVIAVPENFTAHHAKSAVQYAEYLTVIFSPAFHYGDMQNLRNLCSSAGIPVRIVSLQNAFDSADFLRNYGKEAFKNLLEHAGDAVQVALQDSVQGLDEELDRTAIIRKSAEVLSGIKDNLEREIYLSQTAKKLNLSPEQMQTEIDRLSGKKRNFHADASRSLEKSELSAGFQPNIRQRRAEEQILVYLMRFPEEIPNIREKLPPELLVTDSGRAFYQLICQQNGIPEEISPELAEIISKYQEIDFTAESTAGCIQVLLSPRKQVIS